MEVTPQFELLKNVAHFALDIGCTSTWRARVNLDGLLYCYVDFRRQYTSWETNLGWNKRGLSVIKQAPLVCWDTAKLLGFKHELVVPGEEGVVENKRVSNPCFGLNFVEDEYR